MSVRVRQPRARGQHFLRGSALATDIVRAAGVRAGDLVVDVGAGTGVLSSALARAGADVVAVELDPVLAARLRERFPRVVEGDAQRVALPREPYRVVANLPFDGATAILRRLFDDANLVAVDVILQWEVAAKRAAVWPSTTLGVVWGASFELALVRRLPREAFAPPPAVDAGILRATRRAEALVPGPERRAFARFVETGFRPPPDRPAAHPQAPRARPRVSWSCSAVRSRRGCLGGPVSLRPTNPLACRAIPIPFNPVQRGRKGVE